MSQNVNEIDWVQLGFPGFPQALTMIFSDDENVREQGYNILYDENLPELEPRATHEIIPFLVEVLGSPAIKDKSIIALLVTQMSCNARSYIDDNRVNLRMAKIIEALKNSVDTIQLFIQSDDISEIKSDLLECLEHIRQYKLGDT